MFTADSLLWLLFYFSHFSRALGPLGRKKSDTLINEHSMGRQINRSQQQQQQPQPARQEEPCSAARIIIISLHFGPHPPEPAAEGFRLAAQTLGAGSGPGRKTNDTARGRASPAKPSSSSSLLAQSLRRKSDQTTNKGLWGPQLVSGRGRNSMSAGPTRVAH